MGGHAVALEMDKLRVPEGHGLRKLPKIGLGIAAVGFIGSVGLALSGLLGEGGLKQFYFSYLVAFVYFFSLAVGGLFFTLINLAVRAGWSVTLRRMAENAAATLPWFIVLFVPVLAGIHELYHWSHAGEHDAILAAKASWLNVPFFVIRAVIILGSLAWMGWWFRKESVKQDDAGERDVSFGWTATSSSRRLQKAAGPCLAIFALTVSFGAFDWLMSLEPHWYSTIFGGYYFAGSVVSIMSLLIVVGMGLQASGLLGKAVSSEHYHDLGKYLFAFVVFWAYLAFSQFMLIWYANIPEETVWFYKRYQGSWMLGSKMLLFGHFILPFFYLIMRRVKRSRALLWLGAAYMLAIHFFDMRWIVIPTLHPEGMSFNLMDLTTMLAVGGVFLFAFTRLLVSSALIPLKDPRLQQALEFENF